MINYTQIAGIPAIAEKLASLKETILSPIIQNLTNYNCLKLDFIVYVDLRSAFICLC